MSILSLIINFINLVWTQTIIGSIQIYHSGFEDKPKHPLCLCNITATTSVKCDWVTLPTWCSDNLLFIINFNSTAQPSVNKCPGDSDIVDWERQKFDKNNKKLSRFNFVQCSLLFTQLRMCFCGCSILLSTQLRVCFCGYSILLSTQLRICFCNYNIVLLSTDSSLFLRLQHFTFHAVADLLLQLQHHAFERGFEFDFAATAFYFPLSCGFSFTTTALYFACTWFRVCLCLQGA